MAKSTQWGASIIHKKVRRVTDQFLLFVFFPYFSFHSRIITPTLWPVVFQCIPPARGQGQPARRLSALEKPLVLAPEEVQLLKLVVIWLISHLPDYEGGIFVFDYMLSYPGCNLFQRHASLHFRNLDDKKRSTASLHILSTLASSVMVTKVYQYSRAINSSRLDALVGESFSRVLANFAILQLPRIFVDYVIILRG